MFLCEMGVIISPGERQLENVCLRQKKKKNHVFLSCTPSDEVNIVLFCYSLSKKSNI